MKKNIIKKFIFFFLLFFITTTILFTITGYHSRWDFSFQRIPIQQYVDNLPFILFVMFLSAALFTLLTNEGEKKQKERESIYLKQMSERDQQKSGYDIHECRVCGYHAGKPTWGDTGETPSFELCDCCGAQFGKDDVSPEIINEYRNKWISKGRKWFNSKNKPKDHTLGNQNSKSTKENA